MKNNCHHISPRINNQIKVNVYADEKDTRGSINSDQAKTYAEYAKQQADRAKQYADEIEKYTDKHFVFEQNVSSTEWLIQHNLNKYPSITVMDSADNEIICDFKYIDLNTCVLIMNAPFKGKAYLN